MIQRCQVQYIFVCHPFYFRQTEKDHIGRKLNNEESEHIFLYMSNMVAKTPGLDLGKKLSILLSTTSFN